MPCGNGTVGAAVYGGALDERILLNHADLWTEGRTPEMPDVSERLARTRELLKDDRALEADGILSTALREAGYDPAVPTPLPLADLRIRLEGREPFRDYSRELDLATGVATVSWRDGETRFVREVCVLRSYDVVLVRIRREGPLSIEGTVRLEPHDLGDARLPFGEGVASTPREVESTSRGATIRYAASRGESDFGAVARLSVRGGRLEADGTGLRMIDVAEANFAIGLFSRGGRQKGWSRLEVELEEIGSDFDTLRASREAEHRRLFEAADLDLGAEPLDYELPVERLLLDAYSGAAPTALVEKMWAYGRYLLISSTRPGGQPCPLMGLWCGEYGGLWTFHMANENLQMIYWQALSGNLHELLLPVFDYFERGMPDFRTNAKRLFGCEGIFVPAVTAPGSGLLKDLQPHIVHWTGAAGWVAQLFFDYFRYTGDREFLRNRAIPFMLEAAAFYESFFTIENGRAVSSPSISPENAPANVPGIETCVDATMDFAIARELLTNLIRALTQFGENAERWSKLLATIPPYEVDETGAVREWAHPYYQGNDRHRHLSHLYPVFPGTEVSREGSPELHAAFRRALERRCAAGMRDVTGWSLAHMANAFARFGEGNVALDCMDALSRSCLMGNLFTVHNDWRGMGIGVDMEWAPFQIDANMGWTAAVQEMLLQSSESLVKALPALPERWRKGSFRGLRLCGGGEASAAWDLDANMLRLTLLSNASRRVEVAPPWGRSTMAVDPPNAVASQGDTTLILDLPANGEVVLSHNAELGL